jgi:hypothetical protein
LVLGRKVAKEHGIPAGLAKQLAEAGVRDDDIVATAADDYPVLSEILTDRPPPEIVRHAALDVIDAREGKEHFIDRMIDKGYERAHMDTNAWVSTDWCRWHADSHCFYPTVADGHYKAWDRGVCPKKSWDSQIDCPGARPGDNANLPDSLPNVEPNVPHPWMPVGDPREQPLWNNDWIRENFPPIPDDLGHVGG